MVRERLRDRNNVIAILLIGFVLILMLRLIQIQIVSGEYYSDLSENKRIRIIAVEAPRGLFLDRYGREIAGNRPGYVVEIVKTEVVQESISYVAQELVRILDNNGEGIGVDFTIEGGPLRFKLRDRDMELKWKEKHSIPAEYDAAKTLEFLRDKHSISEDMSDELAIKVLAILYKINEQSYLAYQPLEIARDVSMATVAQVEERHLDLSGVNVTVKPIRHYKEGNLASHVLGYLGSINRQELEDLAGKGYTQNDVIGKSGLEKILEEELKGVRGARQVEVNSVGRLISTLGERPSISGNNVFLTLDSQLQQAAERILSETMERIQAGEMGREYPNAKSGAAVVIDVNTGEVLAMVSCPSYNPNLFVTGISEKDWEELNPRSDDPLEPRPLYNNAIQAAVPPGSTFKMVLALAALQEEVITPETIIVGRGIYRAIPGASPACWIWNQNRTTHGPENVVDAIKDSCNYFFYETSRLLGIDKMEEYARKFGLGERTGIELSGEAAGIIAGPTYKTGIWKNVIKRYITGEMNIHDQEVVDNVFSLLDVQFNTWNQMRKALEDLGINEIEHINKLISYINASRWTAGQTLSAAIGQGEHMYTPLQIANYIATIANGGTRYKPYLVKKIYDQQTGRYQYNEPEVLGRVNISPGNLRAVFEGMQAVTKTGGTAASAFRDAAVNIAGKTGTAQNPGYDGYAWFAGFAPYEEPQIAVAVVIFQGGSGNYSAPVAKAIIEEYLKINNRGIEIMPGNDLVR